MSVYFLLFLTIFSYTNVISQQLDNGDITLNFVGKSGGFKVMGFNNILLELIEKRQVPLTDSFVINYHTSLKDDSIQDMSNTKNVYEKIFEYNKYLDVTLYFKKSRNCYMRELRYYDRNGTDYLVREHYYYKKTIPAKFGIKYLNDDLVDSILVEISESSRSANKYRNLEVKKINFFYTNLDPSPNRHRFEYNEKGVAFYNNPLLNSPIVVSSVRMSSVSGYNDKIYNYYLSANVSGIGDGRIYLNDPFHAWPNFESKTGEIEFGDPLTNFLPSSRSIFSVTYPEPYKKFGPIYKVTNTSLCENETYNTPNLYQSKKISKYSKGDNKVVRIDNSFFYDGMDVKKAKNKQISTFNYLSKDSVQENLIVIDNGKKYKYKIIYKISY